MELIRKSNSLQFHYFFKDDSHSIDSILRNECEKEILHIFKEVSETLGLKLNIETLPTEKGGFIETWEFLGKSSAQITLIVSVAAIVMSRFPVENKELTKLQIENLKLDNELKREELEKLNLDFLQTDEELSKETVADSVKLVNKNYKITWRKSNLYKKLDNYNKVESIEILRHLKDKPIGKPIEILRPNFSKFILRTDELPRLKVENTKIDVISPAIKPGKFRWMGFHNEEIIYFLVDDSNFKQLVFKGNFHFSKKYSIEVNMLQDRQINQDGNVKVTKTVVYKVISSIEDDKKIVY